MVEKIDLPFESSLLPLITSFNCIPKMQASFHHPLCPTSALEVTAYIYHFHPFGDPCPFPLLIYYKSLNYDTWVSCNYALLVMMK